MRKTEERIQESWKKDSKRCKIMKQKESLEEEKNTEIIYIHCVLFKINSSQVKNSKLIEVIIRYNSEQLTQ